MRILLAHVRFTFRLIRRSPWFYALVLALLAAGIGTTTAMFSVVESVLLKPLPYEHADDLVDIGQDEADGHASVADFVDWRAQGTTFEQMALVNGERFSVSSPGTTPVRVDIAEATADFFPMFRLKPLLGRLLGADDDVPGGPLVAVISAPFWREHFGADPSVLGRTMTLNSRPYTIVGVAPERFTFASPDSDTTQVWTPFFGSRSAKEVADMESQRGAHFLMVMGRRRHGVSLAEAQAQMTAVAKNLEAAHPEIEVRNAIVLTDLHDLLADDLSRPIWVLFAAVLLVYVVICANVASLILARAHARRAELATRTALGASSSDLVLQVVTETTVVFGIASLLGSALASWLVGEIASVLLDGYTIRDAVFVHLDVLALLAGIGTSILFGLLAGIAPALVTAKVAPANVLKQTSAGAGDHRSHASVRGFLVVTQVAVAFALLTGSALAVEAIVRLLRTPPGFDPTDLATAVLTLPQRKYDDDDKVRAVFRETLRRIAVLPGVESASGNAFLPMGETAIENSFLVEGRPPPRPGEAPVLERGLVLPRYFETMRIPILRGRAFTPEENETTNPVIILSQTAAEKYFPGEDPIGHRIAFGGPPFRWFEIVGIAGDVHQRGLAQRKMHDLAYTPFDQDSFNEMYFVVRTKTPQAVFATLPHLVESVDPELAVSNLTTMQARVAKTIRQPRQVATLLVAFAVASLLLATLGLFGLVSYTTAARTRELGVRLALGSPPRVVVALVVRSGMKLVLLGLGIGLLLSVWVAREVADTVPKATAFDPAVLAPIPLVLGLAGLLACLLPAMRAVRTPPASALRYE